VKDIRAILLTTDLSDTSRKAIAPAVALARKFGAKIIMVYVVELMPPYVVEATAIDVGDLERRQQAMADDELARFAAKTVDSDVEVETVVALGVPYMEIVKLAEQRRIDLIAIATHGRGFLSHLVLGSTTERVLRHAPCPVLVIRDRDVDS
jgi:nucleotide-binding universal stress UspA family protein